jgi:hypothetical protein
MRFYAAEGLLQNHHVHVVGMPEHWGRELPGVVGDSEKKEKPVESREKMKIAWRYEHLGQFGASTNARGGHILPKSIARPNAICPTRCNCMLTIPLTLSLYRRTATDCSRVHGTGIRNSAHVVLSHIRPDEEARPSSFFKD